MNKVEEAKAIVDVDYALNQLIKALKDAKEIGVSDTTLHAVVQLDYSNYSKLVNRK